MSSPGAAAVAALVSAVLLLAGCGATEDASDAAEPSAAADPPGGGSGVGSGRPSAGRASTDDPDTPVPEVPEVLDFTATQVSGEAFDARELAGTDTVFWFWAPWCTECAAAAPEVQAAAQAAPDVRFVGVAGLSSDVDGMQGFVDTHGLTFPQLADADGGVYTRFGITQQDTYVLVSADGDVETVDAYGGDLEVEQLVSDAFG